MKKWMKNFMIAGIILVFVGIGVSAAAVAVGGPRILRHNSGRVANSLLYWGFGDSAYDHSYDEDFDFDDNYDDLAIRKDIHVFDHGTTGDDDAWKLENFSDAGSLSKDGMKEMGRYKNIKELSVEAAGAVVKVVENPDLKDEIIFYAREKSYCGFRYKLKDNDTSFTANYYAKNSRTFAEGYIEIPVGYQFDKAEFSSAASNLYVSSVNADKLELEVSAGTFAIASFEAGELEAKTVAGVLNGKGNVLGDLEAGTDAGTLELYLKGEQTDFRYEMDIALGDIEIEGKHYTGVEDNRTINADAGKAAELSCGAGSMKLSFYQ